MERVVVIAETDGWIRRGLVTAVMIFASLTLVAGDARALFVPPGPPDQNGPVLVSVGFFLSDVDEIDERRETFEFEAVLTLNWRDPRLAFDPNEIGVSELAYQGDYQFAEVYDGWWPELVLANEAGSFDSQSVLMRIAPDGSASLSMEIHSLAETPMALRRFPFDQQRFEAVFEVLGYDESRVVLVPEPDASGWRSEGAKIPEWDLLDLRVRAEIYEPVYDDGLAGGRSQIIATLEMARRPTHMLQVVVIPLGFLVVLTFSVYWMDRESLGDRMDISFIGLLSVVAYQIIVADAMPRIGYFTLMTGFLYSTYLVLAVGVVVNLSISRLDRSGRVALGNRLDETCRWAVPLAFLAVNALSAAYFFVFY